MKYGMIRFGTFQPDFSDLPDFQFDSEESVYIPKDILTPLGNIVALSHYVDANLYHDWHRVIL